MALACLGLTLGLAGPACSDGVAPAGYAVTSVVVEQDTLVATTLTAGSVTWMRFTVPLGIHNEGPAAVTVSSCSSAIVNTSSGGPSLVWTPACLLESNGTSIEPGAIGHFDVQIDAALDGPGSPKWESDVIEGDDYRFAIRLMPVGARGVVPMVLSNPFTLVLEP